MEFNKSEVTVVEQAVKEIAQKEIQQLNDFQLALIGGGIGDVVWG
jgi:hypothetical protein